MTPNQPSESHDTPDATASSEAPAQILPQVSAGQMLKSAREKACVPLSLLSQTLKVPVKQLEALEADDLGTSKGAVFTRGLAAAVCRHLQTDPAPILALLPSTPLNLSPQKTVETTHAAVKYLKSIRPPTSRQKRSVWAWALAMLALIAALLWLPAPTQWVWLQDMQAWVASMGQDDPEELPATSSAPTTETAEAVAMPLPVSQTPVAAVEPPTPTPTPKASPSPAPAVAAAAVSPNPITTPAKPTKPGTVDWVFTATADSWVEVRNGPTTVVWSGLLKAGQSQPIQSPLPANVVVGRAQGVTVTLRGQAFDLKPHTQVTVARFEVKE